MPSGDRASARALSSVQRELPPSMIVSPSSSSPASESTVCWVGSPAGTMIQTERGRSSFDASSSSEPAPSAPTDSAVRTASSLKSNTTHSCSESRWMRWTVFPQRLGITECLGVLQVLERVAGLGYLHVLLRLRIELQEHAVRRTALVVLAGRMEIAGAVAEGRRGLGAIADPRAQLFNGTVELVRGGHVGEDCDVLRRGDLENRGEV